MPDTPQQYCATDKEIFDLLISGKQRLTESVLSELLRDRGIFYSPRTSREVLVDRLSLLTHDYHDVMGIIERRDQSRRGEKTTSLVVHASLSPELIKEVIQSYQSDKNKSEKVTYFQRGSQGVAMNVEYDEYDFSRTRLMQRQRKDAGIEFDISEGVTTVRMPANEKARAIVNDLKERIETHKKTTIQAEGIEATSLSPAHRTEFFTSLISSMPGHSLLDVTTLRVASSKPDQDNESLDLDDDEEAEAEAAKQEMLAYVKSVAIHGSNLVASKEYQQLLQAGFYIWSITWRAKQTESPYHMVQFDASFEDAALATGFKYGARIAQQLKNGEYSKNYRPADPLEKMRLFGLMESTARVILADIGKESQQATQEKDAV